VPPHLVVDISAHGFGHLAMTAPVLEAVAALAPELRLTIRCAIPEAKLRKMVGVPFAHIPRAFDIGMAMRDALHIDVPASLAHYTTLHGDWSSRVAAAAEELAALRPTALLGNIPYLSLAAAAQAGIPAAGFCCLHWGEIFRHYCGQAPGAERIGAEIRSAYAGAQVFLRPAPGIPMPGLDNLVEIGPVARVGQSRRSAILDRLGRHATTRLALLSLGGVPFPLDVSGWPDLGDWVVVSGMPVAGRHPGVVPIDGLGLPYVDVFASVDAVVAKLGYGTVAEAGVNGRPVLYVPRDGWPEEPHLAGWLARHGRCAPVAEADLLGGGFAEALADLCASPAPVAPQPTGVADAAARVVAMLAGAGRS
jgi:hypothetical protein